MSISKTLHSHRSSFTQRRQAWGQMFGRFIRHDRLNKSRSIEECARRAGMETVEWELMEAGQVPATRDELRSIAAALDMEWQGMVVIAFFCRSAWD